MRVHELAKELGLSSKELLAKLHDLGLEAKSHMSALDEAAVALLREAQAGAAHAPAEPAAETPAEGPVAEQPAEEAPPAADAPEPQPEEQGEPEPGPAPADPGKVVKARGPILVRELAEQLSLRPNLVIAELMRLNVLASINQRVDIEIARQIAEKHGYTLEHEKRGAEHPAVPRKMLEEEEKADQPEDLLPRPPVVTFLGHVDHGKTSLLDKIRNTLVVEGESGGITQHIGAYTVDVNGQSITFLDTPGHAAFTAMRARGANLTDIAVIIIAADDGIMPQTREAIMHAQAANVALMVAINKVDLPGVNPDKTKQQLQADGLAPEDWGGSVICVPVSAMTGEGIDHLMEMILLQADVLELRANPKRRGRGFVVEAQMEPGMGPTATLLVTAGTLAVGDAILCGKHWGRVRALINDHGIKVKSAGPSTPVRCLGLSGVPEAGAEFRTCTSDRTAKALAEEEGAKEREEQSVTPKKASLDSLFQQIEDEEKLELKVIVKADTQGSVEAIVHSLEEIKSDKVSLSFVFTGTGNVTENDVMLASASRAFVAGFHVSLQPGVATTAKREGVEIRLHSVIYELIDEVRDAMTGLLSPEYKESVTGHALVRQVFDIGKTGKIAGCYVTDGSVTPKFRVRVKRGDEVLFEGRLVTLKHFQDDVAQVREGLECGIRLDGFAEFADGDILEFYELQEVELSL